MKKSHSKRVDIVSIRMVKEKSVLYKERNVTSPYDAYIALRDFFDLLDREQLVVMCLNTKNEPTCINVVSVGTINSSLVHPREVFKAAILSNANSIIIAHNHPSGDPTPSKEDLNITKRLKEAGEIIGISVIDHIIIGENRYMGLKEQGLI